MIFQILKEPEYLGPLRREAEEAVAKFGWSHRIIDHVPLQDCFLRGQSPVPGLHV